MQQESELAQEIAKQVVKDSQFWIAVIGLLGAIVGSILTILGNFIIHWLNTRKEVKLDKARKKLLKNMLMIKDWRFLSTLSRVIGSNEENTRRLLIEIGARASEKVREDNEEPWGLISKHPLNEISS